MAEREGYRGRRMRWVWLVGGLVGCGLAQGGVVTPDVVDGAVTPDASIREDAQPRDASQDQLPPDASVMSCDPNKPFDPTIGVVEINTASQNESLRTFGNGLGAMFSSNRVGFGGFDLFITSRGTTSSPYLAAANAGSFLNTAYDETAPTLTDDGLSLYFDRKVGTFQIYQAKRVSTSDTFGFGALVPFIGGGGATNDFGPFVSRDGARIYFTSDRKPNVGDFDIYRADVGGSGYFQMPVRLTELSLKGSASAVPVLTADELTMYFASTRPDPQAKGSYDVWRATRATKNDPFGALVVVPELSTGAIDFPSSISNDGCTILLTSDRAGGQLEIYSATRPK